MLRHSLLRVIILKYQWKQKILILLIKMMRVLLFAFVAAVR